MCAGMGTVFIFLCVLIIAIKFSSSVIRSIESRLNQAKPKAEDTDEQDRIVAAIAIGRTLFNAN